jgi:hypothetical protein
MTFHRWREYYLLMGYGPIIASLKAAMHTSASN